MSDEDDNSNNSQSEYDEESFDNESIEEVSDDDESIDEILSESQSEDLLEENDNGMSLSSPVDKLSREEHQHDEDNDLSSLNSKDEPTRESANDRLTDPNEHEVDESDTNDESLVEIVENVQSLSIKTDKTPSEPIITDEAKPIDSNSIPYGIDGGVENSPRTQSESEVEFTVTSQTPTSFNSENHAFHMDIIQKPPRSNASIQQRTRKSNRKSLSFSNERMREIERHNQILLRKILTQKPRKENLTCPNMRITSSAVNRKKQQRQIDLDNQVLKRKIEAISARRHNNLYP